MSSQPVPINSATPEAKKQAAERAARRSDFLYFGGALVVTCGVSLYSWRLGIILAGLFLLLIPVLEILASFMKGLRAPTPAPRGR
jgi:Flp pilus assembly protein TadB